MLREKNHHLFLCEDFNILCKHSNSPAETSQMDSRDEGSRSVLILIASELNCAAVWTEGSMPGILSMSDDLDKFRKENNIFGLPNSKFFPLYNCITA